MYLNHAKVKELNTDHSETVAVFTMHSVTETCHLITAPEQGDESCGTYPKIVKVQVWRQEETCLRSSDDLKKETKEGMLWVS